MTFRTTLASLRKQVAIGALVALTGASAVHAAPIFQDNFETGLGKWSPNLSGQIVVDPLNSSNKVLSFRNGGSGGDIFTSQLFAPGVYHLMFDILGTCVGRNGSCGGFVGIDQFPGGEHWLVSDSPYLDAFVVQNNGAWQHFDVVFTAVGAFRIKLEDFVVSPPAGDVYFDNICVSSTAADSACPASVTTVPEPGSLALLSLGLFAVGLVRRRVGRPE